MPTSACPDQKPNRYRRFGLVAILLLSMTASGLLYFGPHRRLSTQLLAQATKHGLVLEAGRREAGTLSTTLHNVKASLRTNPHLAVEIGRLDIRHWPFMTPQVSIEGIVVHLRGDPGVHLETVASAWFSPDAKLDVRPMEISYEHRPLGKLVLSGAVIERRGDSFEIQAADIGLGNLTWRDVRLSLGQRKGAAIVSWGADAGQRNAELACFPSEGGGSRWLLDLTHGPVRPWFQRLGLDLGDDFTATRAAGSISLDIPDEEARPVQGRVQMVIDDWPLFAPAQAEPMLGRTLSLLSNVVASADGSQWELPRVVLTMPVFSLVGKGRLQLGREKRLVLEVQGERTCRELRGLLPPSRPLEEVRRFFEKTGLATSAKERGPGASLGIRWDTASPRGMFQPAWDFVPGCGLSPWPGPG